MKQASTGGINELLRYDRLCNRIYADERVPNGTRELLLTLAWTALRDPERVNGEANTTRARRILARCGNDGHLRHLISQDVPRYEPPRAWGGPCDGPRLRPYVRRGYGYSEKEAEHRTAGGARCGTDSREHVDEFDLVSGWVTRVWWFCSRHQAEMRRMQEQLATRGARPEVVPNRGGLLPCYFDKTAAAWQYKNVHPWWEPPYHGICANDWPIPGQTIVPMRPRLALVVADLGEVEQENVESSGMVRTLHSV